jgi:hypothetical protein
VNDLSVAHIHDVVFDIFCDGIENDFRWRRTDR